MSRCWDVANYCPFGGEFVTQQVVEVLWARPLVVLYNMSVAGVRVVEFGTKHERNDMHVVSIGHVPTDNAKIPILVF